MEARSSHKDQEVTELFAAHYASLCRIAFLITGDRSVAEEAVMDAFLRTYSGWGRLRDPALAHVYLRRAVVNACRSKLRRRGLEARLRPSPSLDRMSHVPDDVHVVGDAVRTLPARQRACVVLHYYDDLPLGEIARVLDCSVGTVKSQLAKARAKLEVLLAPDYSTGTKGMEVGS